MAEMADVRREQTIVWNTEKAVASSKRKSSVFPLLGATWQLEMVRPLFDGYTISLHRIGNSGPTKPFSVITSVQSTGPLEARKSYRCHGRKVKITECVSILWKCDVKRALKEILGFEDDPEVTVVCVVTDISSTTSGVLNDTVEVTTQTDFDSRLPVKNLLYAKLPSDADLDSLSHDLGKLLEDKVIPDVNLRCGDRTIAAHKAILAARSQVFSAMFQSKMLESETGIVDISDVDAQVLEIFLKYVYSGALPDLSDEVLPSLYAASDKYAVGSLKTACSERMINNLTRENCLNVLLLANAHSDQDFKNVIFNFLLNHMEILKSQEWAKFCLENHILSIEVFQTVVQQKCF